MVEWPKSRLGGIGDRSSWKPGRLRALRFKIFGVPNCLPQRIYTINVAVAINCHKLLGWVYIAWEYETYCSLMSQLVYFRNFPGAEVYLPENRVIGRHWYLGHMPTWRSGGLVGVSAACLISLPIQTTSDLRSAFHNPIAYSTWDHIPWIVLCGSSSETILLASFPSRQLVLLNDP